MKKSTTKILVAALALFMAIGIATGSTFAWFSLNTTVTATGMQVVAKSDNTFLLIGTGDNDTAAEIQAIVGDRTTTALTVSASEAKLYPASPAMTAAEAAYLPASTGKKVGGDAITTAGVQVTDAATAAAVTNWFTANALAPDAAAIDATTARQLTSFAGYVITKTVYLTVDTGANNANNLSVTATITQKTGGTDISAVKILVTTDDGGFATLTSASNTADIKGTNTAITSSTVRTVNIYIYYDGDETPVYTNNAANLTGADITLTFNVDAVPAA